MDEKNQDNNINLSAKQPDNRKGHELDVAGKSLSDALRASFIILKIIMLVLVLVFLASGFRTIGSDEQALVLRFGRIRGIGEERVLGSGLVGPLPWLHWVFPYPIDEIVRIPVQKKISLPIDSFWYYQRSAEILGEGPIKRDIVSDKLNPIRDGYCITRSEPRDEIIEGSKDSDYNIVHCKWQITYKIDDPERFFRNVYVDFDRIQAGQNYADVITENVTPMLKYIVDDSIVSTMVNYTIDDVIFEQIAAVTQHVKSLLQAKLDAIESGMQVVSVQLTDKTWPRQVDEAFQASIKASQESQRAISEARAYAEQTLNEVAGPVAAGLYNALQDETVSEERKEYLWSQLAGTAQDKIAEARAYQTKVVASAEARAEYLKKILPELRKRPKLVMQKIYQDALVDVLANAQDKYIVQPAKDSRGREIRIYINKEPQTKQQKEKQKQNN
jgi:membrane protease subunit HflK